MKAVSRRSVLAGVPAVAAATVAATALPTLPAEAAALPDWRPAGYDSWCHDFRGDFMRVWFRFENGDYREATPRELALYLRENPWWLDEMDPAFVREHFADLDGELFGLFCDLHQTRGDEAAGRAIIGRICETQAETDIGAAMQLELLMDHISYDPLPAWQQRQLLSSARKWLTHDWAEHRDRGITRRDIDAVKGSADLRGYRPAIAAEAGAE